MRSTSSRFCFASTSVGVELRRLLEVAGGALEDRLQTRRRRSPETASSRRGRRAGWPRTTALSRSCRRRLSLQLLLRLSAERRQVLPRLRRRADPAEPEELERTTVRHRVAGAEQQSGGIAGKRVGGVQRSRCAGRTRKRISSRATVVCQVRTSSAISDEHGADGDAEQRQQDIAMTPQPRHAGAPSERRPFQRSFAASRTTSMPAEQE